MTPEHERWAEALAVERMYGVDAAAHVERRIAALDAIGDLAGCARWRSIGERLRRLEAARP